MKQDLKRSVFNFSDVHFALSQMAPLLRFQVRLTFLTDLWVRLNFGQMEPPIGEASDKVDI